ncbi:hypothetical protein N658DRAFT_348010 [Parathielavia hyrcaniae]|uniref:Uncharacterized protein n=1 Tax=Parathielavia hyrcaniae TaxID=113614 RepID=A0AAN6PV01_9PEZI|nr:hypothetical protein N658DRAFT_348010 [Parathielavia hyrcaniae]
MLISHPFTIQTDLYSNLQCQTVAGGTKLLFRKDNLEFLPEHLKSGCAMLGNSDPTSNLTSPSPSLTDSLHTCFSSSHVWPLHHHQTKGRDIVVDEDPRLHLLWHKTKVYIKPIPPYLLSAAFWDYIQTADASLFRAAAGFMRTYVYLIRYEIDFRKATSAELGLIPTAHDQTSLTFEAFVDFLSQFENLSDADVSPRYRSYGQLRLARVNHLTRLVLRRWSYFPRYSRLADELAYFVAAVLALFSVVSIFLGCMQVEIAVMSLRSGEETWPGFIAVSRWFPVAMMALILLLLVVIPALAVGILLKQAVFTLLVLRAKKKDREKAKAMSSSVVG